LDRHAALIAAGIRLNSRCAVREPNPRRIHARLREDPISQIGRHVSVDAELGAHAAVMLRVGVASGEGAGCVIATHGPADQIGDRANRRLLSGGGRSFARVWANHLRASEGGRAVARRSAHDPAFANQVSMPRSPAEYRLTFAGSTDY